MEECQERIISVEEFLTHLTSQVAKTMPGIAAGSSVFIGFWICSVLFKSFMAHVIDHAPNDKKDMLNLLANFESRHKRLYQRYRPKADIRWIVPFNPKLL